MTCTDKLKEVRKACKKLKDTTSGSCKAAKKVCPTFFEKGMAKIPALKIVAKKYWNKFLEKNSRIVIPETKASLELPFSEKILNVSVAGVIKLKNYDYHLIIGAKVVPKLDVKTMEEEEGEEEDAKKDSPLVSFSGMGVTVELLKDSKKGKVEGQFEAKGSVTIRDGKPIDIVISGHYNKKCMGLQASL